MITDIRKDIFSSFIKLSNQNKEYYDNIYFVFKSSIYPFFIKRYEDNLKKSCHKDKTKFKIILNELINKVTFEQSYDDFHNCFNFSFSIAARKNIFFQIDYSVYHDYKKVKIYISKSFYNKILKDRAYTTLKYIEFLDHFKNFNKIIKNDFIIEYDIKNLYSNSYENISNIYLEYKSNVYPLKVKKNLIDDSSICINNYIYYDKNFEKLYNNYSSYYHKELESFKFDLEYSFSDNTISIHNFTNDSFYKDISNGIISVVKDLNISLDELNVTHLKLAELYSY